MINKFAREKNRLFVLSFYNDADKTIRTGYYLLKIEIKYYNVMIDARNILINLLKIA